MTTVDLERALRDAGLAAPARWLEVTGSTNAAAMAMADEGAPEWTLVGAGHQTRGRGRLGRTWHDRAGGSLMTSIVLRPPLAPADAGILTLLAGAAWAEAASEVAALPVRCRWPNDLMLGDDKLGGILAEASVAADGSVRHVVIGSGVNLSPPTEADGAAGLGGDVDATVLLTAFLRALRTGYRPGDTRFADGVTTRWRNVSATLGRTVRATRVDGVAVEGRATDVDAGGSLLVETDAGLQTVTFGDLHHLD
jgi:BirA family biotin operon repressor/biotin-[acetyl-CoA-carboxylase] ligase